MRSEEQEIKPCAFCGKSCGKITPAVQLLGEDYQDERSEGFFAVVCDASKPGGCGGCGAMGGFQASEQEAIAVWNARASLSTPPDIPKGAVGVMNSVLTEAEIIELADKHDVMSFHYDPSKVVAFARAILAAATGSSSEPAEKAADTLLRAIQRLNQNPYNLTKSECIDVLQEMHEGSSRAALSAAPVSPEPEKGDASKCVNMSLFATRADYDAAINATEAASQPAEAVSEGIHSPFNACMFRDECRSRALAATPVAAQPVNCHHGISWRFNCDDCRQERETAAVEPANLSACNFCLDQARQARDDVAAKVDKVAGVRAFLETTLRTNSRDLDDWRQDLEDAVRTLATMAAEPVAPAKTPDINGKPATAHSLLAALVDIYDDGQNAPPEHRCYDENAWHDVLTAARNFIAVAEPVEGAEPARDAHRGGSSYEASMLRNLLARIHRDGGHYLEAHGLDKALEDADQIVSQLLSKEPSALEISAVEELAQLGYTVRNGLLYPPPAPASAQAGAVPEAVEKDADGEAFRKAAALGLTLRFYGGCAQSSMPGSPCAYEVVTGSDRAASMREAVDRAATVIATGGESQRIRPVDPEKVLAEHSGCGSNTQVDQLTVRLNPGDKVVLRMGPITAAIDRLAATKAGAGESK